MRNFRCKAFVDGRKTLLAFGPRGKDGGMGISVFANDNGESIAKVHIDCSVVFENLIIRVLTPDQDIVTITIPKAS